MKKNRLEKVIGNMERMGLDQLVVSDPSSIYYLTGIFIDPGERLFALLVKSDGSATLFNNRLFPLAGQEGLQIVWHSDGEDAIGMLAEAVADGPLGVDKAWPARFLIELMARRGGAKPVLGSAAVDDARMYKDAEEIELMRAASRVNDAAMAEAIAALAPGISESKMVGIIGELHVKHGADAALPQLVCYGAGCSEPHHESGPATLKPGDSVILDIFAPVNRYWCDMTRTVFYKSATDEQKRVYEIVRQANLAGIAAVAPGVPLRDIDAAARKVIEDAGYGRYFTHRLGHGIGLDVHEPPDCSAVSDAIARPGMCFSIEPGIYLPGQWGVRIEDLVVVTEDGVEVLNSYTKELQIIE
ncbi:MAG: aminopeptidase P family protein [Firmicutes bacterium]|nr:aminopeptidase P family protein [Bacillota bacterium]HOB34351.1 Xaa-Pro peptidase family protein [Bacillota bacterium]HPZ90820.1 Xaa-Pro peptidase family protein [Bacillota bacterium]HQE02527.1 Xaa-Pro peptidase family protein [Bacillota bacterium]